MYFISYTPISGTLGSYKLGHSGGFSATGDFSHAMALNPTPSQEYLHLLPSPGKMARLERDEEEGSIDLDSSRAKRDWTTRENTRSNRLQQGRSDGGLTVLRQGDQAAPAQASSLTFDSNTLKLDPRIEETTAQENECEGEGVGENNGNSDSKADDNIFHESDDEDSLNFGLIDAIAVDQAHQTGDYSHALSMFSPNSHVKSSS